MLFHKCAKNSICSTTVGNATVIPGSDTYYNAADLIRSSRVLVDANGNLDQEKDYSPYGKGDGGHGALSKYLFSGKSKPGAEIPMHRENTMPVASITLASGIIEAQRRSGSQPCSDWLLTDDPTIGRWLSTDPVPGGKPAGSGQFHSPYLYAGNNPFKFVEPDGEWFFTALFATLGAYLGGRSMNSGEDNPFKWDYSNPNTWLGIGGGAILGGAAGVGFEYALSTTGFGLDVFGHNLATIGGTTQSSLTASYVSGGFGVSSLSYGALSNNMISDRNIQPPRKQIPPFMPFNQLDQTQLVDILFNLLHNRNDISEQILTANFFKKFWPDVNAYSNLYLNGWSDFDMSDLAGIGFYEANEILSSVMLAAGGPAFYWDGDNTITLANHLRGSGKDLSYLMAHEIYHAANYDHDNAFMMINPHLWKFKYSMYLTNNGLTFALNPLIRY
jgi:hypothetical protein